jgi:uncharacterized protein
MNPITKFRPQISLLPVSILSSFHNLHKFDMQPNLRHNTCMTCDCNSTPPALVATGIALFNQGKYFEAHEALENAWRAERSAIRCLYQGILQIGVGFYHLQRGNRIGAEHLLLRGLSALAPFPSSCMGINLEALRSDAAQVYGLVLQTKNNPSSPVMPSYFPKIKFTHP